MTPPDDMTVRFRSFTIAACLLAGLLLAPEWTHAQQHFTNCLSSDVNDATVIVPDTVAVTLGESNSLSTGDEIALFSNDGRCAGVGVWDETEDALSITVVGVDSTADIVEGYETEEELKYRIWRQSDGTEFEVSSAAYTCSLPNCRSDGLYGSDAIYEVSALDASSALPVELSRFQGTRDGEAVILEWETASETNNSGFKVQQQTADGTWSTLSFVEGAGTVSSPQSYQYEASDLDYGTHQFRLTQVDNDGSESPSKTVEVKLSLETAYSASNVYPNPVRQAGSLDLTVKKGQQVVIRLYDVLGREQGVLVNRELPPNQTKTLQLTPEDLPSGQYFLRIEGETFQATRRLTIVR